MRAIVNSLIAALQAPSHKERILLTQIRHLNERRAVWMLRADSLQQEVNDLRSAEDAIVDAYDAAVEECFFRQIVPTGECPPFGFDEYPPNDGAPYRHDGPGL